MLRRKYPYQSSRHKALALCVTFAFELVGGVRLADEHDRVGKGLDIKAGRVCIDREALGLGKVGEACQLAYERGNELFEKKVSDAELVESSADEGFTVWDHHPPGHVFNGSYSNNTTEGDLDELKCRDGELCHAVENDFFGLHDLLLVGWSTPFVHDPLFSDGAYQIRDLVLRLIEYLTHYHPVENCRKQLTEIVKNNTELLQKSHNDTENSDLWNMTYQYRAEQKVVLPAARHMWSCLPGKYTEDDFAKRWDECTQEGESDSTGPYLPEYMRDWPEARLEGRTCGEEESGHMQCEQVEPHMFILDVVSSHHGARRVQEQDARRRGADDLDSCDLRRRHDVPRLTATLPDVS
eukprot:TRINITY_DN10157_c0_g1_i2.p1 TRINITY_DN10157_c0_g1~~TRINITY_DN10157_c0_g1_i2.p1  ORF type:complete len:352 (+),score=69.62 TRINITY_DN10157_c0_g1_i2:42-1097(+)